jgi:hypothetical protein
MENKENQQVYNLIKLTKNQCIQRSNRMFEEPKA